MPLFTFRMLALWVDITMSSLYDAKELRASCTLGKNSVN